MLNNQYFVPLYSALPVSAKINLLAFSGCTADHRIRSLAKCFHRRLQKKYNISIANKCIHGKI